MLTDVEAEDLLEELIQYQKGVPLNVHLAPSQNFSPFTYHQSLLLSKSPIVSRRPRIRCIRPLPNKLIRLTASQICHSQYQPTRGQDRDPAYTAIN